MSVCASCGATIRFVATTKGRSMPVDEHPGPDGNIDLQLLNGKMTAVVLGDLERSVMSRPLYTSHFASCPNAAEHRKT